MKQARPPCGIVAAAGTEEMLQALLLAIRDVQESIQMTGPPLRVSKAASLMEVRRCMAPAGAASVPEILLWSLARKDAACLEELLLMTGKNAGLQVLLLVSRELHAQIAYRCRQYPVYVLPLPLKRQVLSEMLRMILYMRGRVQEREEELVRLRKKMNEIGIVTKAKCLLIQERHMTEEEAHHYLEKEAMDHGRTRREVAVDIIRKYS